MDAAESRGQFDRTRSISGLQPDGQDGVRQGGGACARRRIGCGGMGGVAAQGRARRRRGGRPGRVRPREKVRRGDRHPCGRGVSAAPPRAAVASSRPLREGRRVAPVLAVRGDGRDEEIDRLRTRTDLPHLPRPRRTRMDDTFGARDRNRRAVPPRSARRGRQDRRHNRLGARPLLSGGEPRACAGDREEGRSRASSRSDARRTSRPSRSATTSSRRLRAE